MTAQVGRSLWFDFSESRYFLIPSEETLPEGDLMLVTLTGGRRSVDPAAVAAWEVDEGAAMAHLQAGVMHSFTNVQESLAHFFSSLVPPAEGGAQEPSTPSGEDLQLLAGVFGVAPTTLQVPAGSRAGFEHFLRCLADTLEDCIAEDAGRLQAVHRRLDDWRTNLKAQDVEVGSRLDDLPERIRAWYFMSDEPQKFHEMVDVLRTLATRIHHAPADPNPLQHIFQDASQALNELFDMDEPEADRRERYREMARDAVQGSKLPTFDFKQVWRSYQDDNPE
jgi:hypothetical protein